MSDLSRMQHNYHSRYLVTIDNEQSIVNIYKHEKCKFEESFLVLKSSKKFIEKNGICRMSHEFAIVLILMVIPF